MFRPVPALLTLAATGALLPALEISDNDTKFAFTLYAQSVAAKATATNATGDAYNATEGINGRGDDADLYMRRVRTGFKGTYKGYLYQATLAADNLGRASQAIATGPSVTIWDAFLGKEFKMDGITHRLTFGKQNTWFNTVVSRSTVQLMPASRASAELMASNGVGFQYRMTAPVLSFGVDVQNNTGDDYNQTNSAPNNNQNPQTGTNYGEGMYYTARLELTGPDADSWAIGKWQESYAGAAGKGIALGFDAGANRKDNVDRDGATAGVQGAYVDTFCYGADILLHVDGLTALAEARHQIKKTSSFAATPSDDSTGSTVQILQAGYAFPLEGLGVLEPAARYQKIDLDTANDNEGLSYGWKDYGNSGKQIDLGVNLYLASHGNKLSLLYTSWKGEDSSAANGETPTAKIVRLQHQLNF